MQQETIGSPHDRKVTGIWAGFGVGRSYTPGAFYRPLLIY